jgi:hypothetical protein
MISDWFIDQQGKLKRPVIKLYAALLNLPESRMGNLVFRFDGSQKNKAETWGVNDIRINPEAYAKSDDPEWLGTIVHELTHEHDYFKSKRPDFLIRFFDQAGIKFREFILGMPHETAYMSSPLEKRAFANQKIIMDFVNKFSIQKILTDAKNSESKKISLILNLFKDNK